MGASLEPVISCRLTIARNRNGTRTRAGLLVFLALLARMVLPAVAGDTNATDNTYCQARYNLDLSTKNYISVPTVVDIDPGTGNLLVRGQVPLNLRDASDHAHGCRMHAGCQPPDLNALFRCRPGRTDTLPPASHEPAANR